MQNTDRVGESLDRGTGVPPFPPGYRASGLLLHVTSLPSAYRIGDLGPSAFRWVLNLGNEARMNVPGRPEGNWRWRCTEEILCESAFERLRDLTKASGRLR